MEDKAAGDFWLWPPAALLVENLFSVNSCECMKIETVIRGKALELGFAACGFAPAGPCSSHDRLTRWLAMGCNAGMDYMAKTAELRADPRRLFPETRSVVVAAAAFNAVSPFPLYAGFACGLDYHDVLRAKLRHIAREIEKLAGPDFGYRICVDSAPLLEREWALRAGIGRLGRQGCVVNDRLGCRMFLCELLVNIELAPSRPDHGDCGKCRACVDACPTGALRPDGFLDARKCLSYLTIEHKGEWPENAPAPRHKTLFGCDCCVAACPLNRNGDELVLPEFRAPPIPYPTARECLEMTEAEFERVFDATPVARIGLEKLKRNATQIRT